MTTAIFSEEVIQTHVEIEQWFAGVAPQGTLENLLARFSPEFSMIAPATSTGQQGRGQCVVASGRDASVENRSEVK